MQIKWPTVCENCAHKHRFIDHAYRFRRFHCRMQCAHTDSVCVSGERSAPRRWVQRALLLSYTYARYSLCIFVSLWRRSVSMRFLHGLFIMFPRSKMNSFDLVWIFIYFLDAPAFICLLQISFIVAGLIIFTNNGFFFSRMRVCVCVCDVLVTVLRDLTSSMRRALLWVHARVCVWCNHTSVGFILQASNSIFLFFRCCFHPFRPVKIGCVRWASLCMVNVCLLLNKNSNENGHWTLWFPFIAQPA